MTTIFVNHQLTDSQRQQLKGYISMLKHNKLHSKQVSVSVFGAGQSGKTTCALCLADSPVTSLPPSNHVTSVIQLTRVSEAMLPYSLFIYDTEEFMLTNTVILLVDATAPESFLEVDAVARQVCPQQLVFILVTKSDIAPRQQLSHAIARAESIARLLEERQARCQVTAVVLKDNRSRETMQNVLLLSYSNMLYQNSRAETLRHYKTLQARLEANGRLCSSKVSSLKVPATEDARTIESLFSGASPAEGDGDSVSDDVERQYDDLQLRLPR